MLISKLTARFKLRRENKLLRTSNCADLLVVRRTLVFDFMNRILQCTANVVKTTWKSHFLYFCKFYNMVLSPIWIICYSKHTAYYSLLGLPYFNVHICRDIERIFHTNQSNYCTFYLSMFILTYKT